MENFPSMAILKEKKMKKQILAIVLTCAVTFAQTVKVKWHLNTEEDLAGYKVYYGLQSRNYFESVNSGNVTQQIINNLLTDTLYYFAVTAYDKSGNESDYSAEVQFKIKGDTLIIPPDTVIVIKDTIPPGIPTGLTIEEVTPEVSFLWTAKDIGGGTFSAYPSLNGRLGLYIGMDITVLVNIEKAGTYRITVNCTRKSGTPELFLNGESFEIIKYDNIREYTKDVYFGKGMQVLTFNATDDMWFFGDAIRLERIND